MTPELKAKELIGKFQAIATETVRKIIGEPSIGGVGKMSYKSATQCAIICVEEILNLPTPLGLHETQYWRQVLNILNQ